MKRGDTAFPLYAFFGARGPRLFYRKRRRKTRFDRCVNISHSRANVVIIKSLFCINNSPGEFIRRYVAVTKHTLRDSIGSSWRFSKLYFCSNFQTIWKIRKYIISIEHASQSDR